MNIQLALPNLEINSKTRMDERAKLSENPMGNRKSNYKFVLTHYSHLCLRIRYKLNHYRTYRISLNSYFSIDIAFRIGDGVLTS